MSWNLLKYFKKITVSLIPGTTGSYVDGEWVLVLGAPAPLKIITPQPLTANDAQQLPDGEHVRDYIKSWSETKVYPREGGDDADRILWNSDTYKVTQTDNRATVGGFFAFEMRRLEPGTT